MRIKFKKKNPRAVEPGGNKFGKFLLPSFFFYFTIFLIFVNFFLNIFCTTTALLEGFRTCKKYKIGGSKHGATKQLRCGSGNFSFSY